MNTARANSSGELVLGTGDTESQESDTAKQCVMCNYTIR